MKRHLKNVAIPHEGNDYRPHALRPHGVGIVACIALVLLAASVLYVQLAYRSDFLAAIIPDVLIDLTNDDRVTNGLARLQHNPTLTYAAQLKANHMAAEGYFSHDSPSGVTPWHWFIESGYQFSAAGENLAVHFSDSDEVEEAWMNSPGHRANILNSNFTEIGIATARGRYEGYNTIFVVQLFGRPAPGAVASVSTTTEEDEPALIVEQEPEPDEPAVSEPVATVPPPTSEPIYEVIEETDTFIAIEVTGEVPSDEEPRDAVGLLEPESSVFERVITSPYQLVQWAYLILMLFIAIILILTIVIEFEKQHPRNVLYGAALLILVILLLYITRTYVFTPTIII